MKSEKTASVIPYIGMPATLVYFSDREPGTVVDMSPSGKTIYVQEDNAIRTDNNGMSEIQEYEYFEKAPFRIGFCNKGSYGSGGNCLACCRIEEETRKK